MSPRVLAVILALLALEGAQAEFAVIDAKGRIRALAVAGEYLPVRVNLRVPLKGWERQPNLDDAREVKVTRQEGKTTWLGLIEVEPGQDYRFEETLEEQGPEARLSFTVTAEADVAIEGVFLWVDVPISLFAGGTGKLAAGGATVAEAELPREQPATRHFLRGDADALTLAAADERASLDLTFDRALPVVVQDTREWKGTDYAAFCQLAPALGAGESTTLTVTLRPTLRPDTSPAILTLDVGKVRYRLDGFGGNYCFGIESPVTQYTLENLKVAWARTEMTSAEWEPENDNEFPVYTNWAVLEARDKPGSNLRREFELARQIQQRGVPYVISIWHLPEWLYSDPGKGSPQAHGRQVSPEKWPELLECIGSYLVYAKRQYGVEPDLFCFNEPNLGVRVKFSPEEHRNTIKSIGAHLKALGLRTKMVLGDVTGPRGTHTYCLPTAEDLEALRYVGAVAFHSWGGGSPEDYSAWADLAERLKLPLLVNELGVDGGAWRTKAFDSYCYAMEEVRMYQELLLYARPQGTMQWEFTSDYSIVQESRNAAGEVVLTPTVRFFFVKHFCNLTPHHSDALGVASDNPKVLFTAFAGTVSGQPAYTLHVANLGAEREAFLSGLPRGLTHLYAVRTSEEERFQTLDAVEVRDGTLKLVLAPQSLLTLTTLPPE